MPLEGLTVVEGVFEGNPKHKNFYTIEKDEILCLSSHQWAHFVNHCDITIGKLARKIDLLEKS